MAAPTVGCLRVRRAGRRVRGEGPDPGRAEGRDRPHHRRRRHDALSEDHVPRLSPRCPTDDPRVGRPADRAGASPRFERRDRLRHRPVREEVRPVGLQLRPRRRRAGSSRTTGKTSGPRSRPHFGQMKKLGANVVRIHLQLGKFMDGPDKPNAKALDRLGKLLELAERTGLYLDLTGPGLLPQEGRARLVRQARREGPLGGAGPRSGRRWRAAAPPAPPSSATT